VISEVDCKRSKLDKRWRKVFDIWRRKQNIEACLLERYKGFLKGVT